MSMTFAFVMDPLEGVNVHTDTSFAFMLAAQDRGHRVIHVPHLTGLTLHGDRVHLSGRHVEVSQTTGSHFRVVESVFVEAIDCAAIFIRTDPPFDQAYLTTTWMLSLAEQQGVRVINSPRGVRSANEKLYALSFAELCPPTRVTADRQRIREWVDELGGEAIAKPIDGHGGYGVVRLRAPDSNLSALVDLLTHEGRIPIVVQQYLPEAAAGDRRLLVIDGQPRGVVARVPPPHDHRGNVHVGGRAEGAEVTDDDRRIVAAMKQRLSADGLFFVGLDVIAGKLIEVNVTSPTLVQELRDAGGPDLAAAVIASAESTGRG